MKSVSISAPQVNHRRVECLWCCDYRCLPTEDGKLEPCNECGSLEAFAYEDETVCGECGATVEGGAS